MKKAIYYIIPALVALSAFAFAQDTTHITATVLDVDGHTPRSGVTITVTRADRNGTLYLIGQRKYVTGADGKAHFTVPRTKSGDTAYVNVQAPIGNLSSGKTLAVPNAATANLSSLVTASNYNTYVLFSGGGTTDTTYIYKAIAAAQQAHGDSIFIADSIARVDWRPYWTMKNADAAGFGLTVMGQANWTKNIYIHGLATIDTSHNDYVDVTINGDGGVLAPALADSLDANARGMIAKRDSSTALSGGYATLSDVNTKAYTVRNKNVRGSTINSLDNYVDADAVHIKAYNNSGGALTAGTAVYVVQWNTPNSCVEVGRAANTSAATMPAIGLVERAIADGGVGEVRMAGTLDSVNTNAWSEGAKLYVGTAGALTSTAPTGTAKGQMIGTVGRQSATVGVIAIGGSGRYSEPWLLTTAYQDSIKAAFRADSLTASDINWGGTFSTMRVFKTITGANTFTFSNLPASGYSKTIIVTIYSGAGGGTVAWPANVRWSGGTAPTITATAGKYDIVTLVYQHERGIVSGTFVQNFAE